jgi:hypothetical protein
MTAVCLIQMVRENSQLHPIKRCACGLKDEPMERGREDDNKDDSSESDETTSMYISRHFRMERTD